ncbi:hypothetical protein LTR84_011581 [Exophiala bonariae]|uniref:C2H2-type domain-containing protein n=1 Tax=Exophiala bonariae TaxID=1690606 RepID=A0AAV9NGU1_9EURO|nr:hypothetical protein LTR84_011581 [Exophiala bonariae]
MANSAQNTQATPDPFHTALNELLVKFKNRLTARELQRFKGTTLEDVKATLADIEKRQDTQRELRNLTRIRGFLDAMDQFGKVIEVFPNSSNMVAFVWGPLKFLLQTSSTWASSLDRILDAYEQIGEALPLLTQYKSLFEQHPEMQRVLVLIYKDILEFHAPAIRFFDHPVWRQLFRSIWNDFKANFDGILQNFGRHRRLIESQFALLQARQHEADRIDTETHRAHLKSELSSLSRELHSAQRLLERAEEERKRERLSSIKEWIGGSNPGVIHAEMLKVRDDYSETGNWIKSSSEVSCWLNDDIPRSSTLWMHGMPGAGKSVLASIIIEACRKQENHRTAYYYCRSDDINTLSSLAILKGILIQQLAWYPHLASYFQEQRQQKPEVTLNMESTARQIFETIAWESDRQYIIIDGLDECEKEDRKMIISFLTSLITKIDAKIPSKLRLLIISQTEPDIRRLVERAREFELKANHNAQDIGSFVHTWMARLNNKFGLPEVTVTALEQRTCSLAKGQFLFAKLVMENLFSQPTRDELYDELEETNFPKELSQAYDRIFERMKRDLSKKEWKVAIRLLGWITCAERTLKWREMQAALSISPDQGVVDFDGRQAREHIHNLCGALVSVNGERVMLVHATAKWHILKSSRIDITDIEFQLATLCLQYLCFQCFNVVGNNTVPQWELHSSILDGSFGFMDYAIPKWMGHFDRVYSKASYLSDPSQFEQHELVMQALCEAAHDFCITYSGDLDLHRAETNKLQEGENLSKQFQQVLDQFEDSEPSFRSLWSHMVEHRQQSFVKRNEVSLNQLKVAMDTIRSNIEEMSNNRSLARETREKLEKFYGSRPFKCPKTTCFYFHEGFLDKKTRDHHVQRHDRPHHCAVPDCTVAEAGFATKKLLDQHTENFHLDPEVKAGMFKDIKPEKPSHAKFDCGKCGKSFVRRSILKDHELTHAGLRPHECSRCGKAFTRKSDCTRHEKNHDIRR